MKRILFLFSAFLLIPLSVSAAPAWWKVNDQNNTLWFSFDGEEWNQAWEMSWVDEEGVWYKIDKENQVWWSTDGENWSAVEAEAEDDWMVVSNGAFKAADGKWYQYDANLQLWWTTDGENWSRVPAQAFPSVDGKWLKYDTNGDLWWSSNQGRTWAKAPEKQFEGADGVWYQYDSEWNLWKKQSSMSHSMNSDSDDWMRAPDNIWKDRHGHWYKFDSEGNVWVSTDGEDWKSRRSRMWFGPNKLYRVSQDGMIWEQERGGFMASADNTFEGPDGVWYQIDSNWNVWWKQ